ncbi:unnamed protein product [Microthlaspi erraticum]|uniref:Replication protein A 70 kDa DNA-binding subunit B/D first OB fold domain-containing protein n=1 Tax=Microthlaspi erraticum TaxID=1685480 RepID=A0A6D2L8S1_9BRAS|nr:unnamed protein product [Microthlaspi erraticum]
MASYAMVADLHSMVTNTMLVVKVLKKWVNAGPRGVDGLDAMVVDEAGTLIQASVTRNEYVGMFDDQLEEGLWYSLSNFYVVKFSSSKTEQLFTDGALSWILTLRYKKYHQKHRVMLLNAVLSHL